MENTYDLSGSLGMGAFVLPNIDTSYLDKDMLDENGLLKVMPAKFYQGIPQAHLSLWCNRHAVYGLPTNELVYLIKHLIGDKRAIEIGAGNGCLGRALGIPMTDSKVQEDDPQISLAYKAIGQPTVKYPKDVIKMTAAEAIAHYKPEIVVASWVTQKWRKGQRDGFVHGVDEEALLRRVDKYIFFGNHSVHRYKLIGKYPVTVYQDDEQEIFFSRSMQTQANIVYEWGNILKLTDLEVRTWGTMADITMQPIRFKPWPTSIDEADKNT